MRRPKKIYPPGTFIAKPARIMAILQLCMAFTLIAWSLSIPFLEEYYHVKSQELLYQNIMGIETDKDASTISNSIRFSALPEFERMQIIDKYDELQLKGSSPFWKKSLAAMRLLLFGLPSFELAWITFSIALSIMLLLRIEGAAKAIWLLPIIVVAYAGDIGMQKPSDSLTADAKLFPSEQLIIDQFIEKPLSKNILEQQQELKQGWQKYLITVWAKDIPSPNLHDHQLQLENGEFAFNLARLKAIIASGNSENSPLTHHREPLIILIVYLIWNIAFAYAATKAQA